MASTSVPLKTYGERLPYLVTQVAIATAGIENALSRRSDLHFPQIVNDRLEDVAEALFSLKHLLKDPWTPSVGPGTIDFTAVAPGCRLDNKGETMVWEVDNARVEVTYSPESDPGKPWRITETGINGHCITGNTERQKSDEDIVEHTIRTIRDWGDGDE